MKTRMKRSEFLAKLVMILEDSHGGFGDKHEEEAEYILTAMEKQGMIKPEYEPYPGAEHSAVFQQWEPEDA